MQTTNNNWLNNASNTVKKPFKLYLAIASLAIVFGGISTGVYFFVQNAMGKELPPSLEFLGDQGFIGTGTYIQFENSDIEDSEDLDFGKTIKPGVQLLYSQTDTTLSDVIDAIKPDKSLKIMFAYYNDKTRKFDVFPKGPYAKTNLIDANKLEQYEIPANRGFFLVANKEFEVSSDLKKFDEAPATSSLTIEKSFALLNSFPSAKTDKDDKEISDWRLIMGSVSNFRLSCDNRILDTYVTDKPGSSGVKFVKSDEELKEGFAVWVRMGGENGICIKRPMVTGISATPSDESVELKWEKAIDTDSFELEEYEIFMNVDESTTRYSSKGKVSVESAIIEDLVNDNEYSFYVVALDSDGKKGIESNFVKVTPRDETSNPSLGAVGTFTATPGDESVSLTWTAPSPVDGVELKGYDIEFIETDSLRKLETDTLPPSPMSIRIDELENDKEYSFTIYPLDIDENRGVGKEIKATPAITSFGAVRAFTATPGDKSVSLTWTAPSAVEGVELSGYSVVYGKDNSTSNDFMARDIAPNVLNLKIDNLVNNQRYKFTIYPVDSDVKWGVGKEIKATPAITSFGAVGTFTATPRDESVNLAWTAPSAVEGLELSRYEIDYNDTDTSTETILSANNRTTHKITELTNGTSYLFKIYAVDSDGNRGAVREVSATPIADQVECEESIQVGLEYVEYRYFGDKDNLLRFKINVNTVNIDDLTLNKTDNSSVNIAGANHNMYTLTSSGLFVSFYYDQQDTDQVFSNFTLTLPAGLFTSESCAGWASPEYKLNIPRVTIPGTGVVSGDVCINMPVLEIESISPNFTDKSILVNFKSNQNINKIIIKDNKDLLTLKDSSSSQIVNKISESFTSLQSLNNFTLSNKFNELLNSKNYTLEINTDGLKYRIGDMECAIPNKTINHNILASIQSGSCDNIQELKITSVNVVNKTINITLDQSVFIPEGYKPVALLKDGIAPLIYPTTLILDSTKKTISATFDSFVNSSNYDLVIYKAQIRILSEGVNCELKNTQNIFYDIVPQISCTNGQLKENDTKLCFNKTWITCNVANQHKNVNVYYCAQDLSAFIRAGAGSASLELIKMAWQKTGPITGTFDGKSDSYTKTFYDNEFLTLYTGPNPTQWHKGPVYALPAYTNNHYYPLMFCNSSDFSLYTINNYKCNNKIISNNNDVYIPK